MSVSRRLFFQKVSAISLLGWYGFSAFTPIELSGRSSKIIKPPKLNPGDTVGLINPSGAVYETEPYEMARDVLTKLGLEVKMGKHVHDRYGHLGGKDADRAADINDMFRDKHIKAIFCLRGGSGAARILDLLDYKMIAKNPKILIGYSDITAFLLAIYAKTGLVTFHGPVASSDWNDFSLNYFRPILFDAGAPLFQNPPKGENEFIQTDHRIRTINPGKASGVLAGGNLSVLTGMVGSDYLPDWKDKILFVEDVGEKIYRIDRMMSQLKLAGILDKLNGFIFGKCTHCSAGEGYGSLTLEEVIDHYIKPLGIPAYSGAMIGHIDKKFTVPIGISATIDADKGTIQLNESAVV